MGRNIPIMLSGTRIFCPKPAIITVEENVVDQSVPFTIRVNCNGIKIIY